MQRTPDDVVKIVLKRCLQRPWAQPGASVFRRDVRASGSRNLLVRLAPARGSGSGKT